jgi:LysM repeat protein
LKIPVDDACEIEPTAVATSDGTSTPSIAATAEGEVTIHVVQPGEWLWEIARQYGVDPQAIIDANNLSDPGALTVGQELIIP